MAGKKPGGEGGIKNLLVQHVEKMALGVAVLLVFLFIYFGMSNKPLEEQSGPESLQQEVKRAHANIEKPTWNEEARVKEITDPVFSQKAREATAIVRPDKYQISWFDPPFTKKLSPRWDPTLMPVANLEVEGVIAALADDKAGAGGAARPRPRPGGAASLLGGAGDDSTPPTLREEQLEALNTGFRGGSSGAVGKAFVVVKGTVPALDQQVEYDRCFVEHMGYQKGSSQEMLRDRPNYIFFYVERQEVGLDGKPVDGASESWTRLSTKSAVQYVAKWPEVEEPADPRFLDPLLTMKAPPVLLRDYVSFIMHPDVPKFTIPEATPEDEAAAGLETRGEDLPGDLPDLGIPPVGAEGMLEGPRGRPARMPEGGGLFEGPAGAGMEEEPAECRLFRFYDFDVDPTKQYRYRVKLVLEDPNNPRDPSMVPYVRSLEEKVADRLKQQRKADEAKTRPSRTYWRETDWSETSPAVSFPPLRKVLAGDVTAARELEFPGRREKVVLKDAEAEVMALVWDEDEAVWVPGVAEELLRGSVVNFSKDAWVVEPTSLGLKKLDNFSFDTGYTLADLYGGQALPSNNRKSKLTAPGEVLLVGEDGSLRVQSTFEDADTYWKYHYGAEESSTTPRRPRPRREDEDRRLPPGEFGGLLE